MRTASVIATIPTQPGGQILESGETTARGTLTEKDPTGTPAKAAHNWRTRAQEVGFELVIRRMSRGPVWAGKCGDEL